MQYTTISGHVLEFSPTPTVRAHLEELTRLAADPAVPEATFIAAAYSPTSPILDATVMPGLGTVTPAVLANPAYAVVRDLLYRKSLSSRGIDVARVAEQYMLTPQQAADQLGLHVSAVRQAIASGRLASWLRDGRHYLHPDAVRAFAPERRGPAPESKPVHVLHGSREDRVLKIKADVPLAKSGRPSPGLVEAELPAGWARAIVLTVEKPDRQRAFLLVPSSVDEDLAFPPFHVRGRFRIEDKVNNSKAARAAWEAFEARTNA
jgi:excisionase family DNA binding protein